MTVGERMKELRQALGINQTDFADKIGVSKQTLYKYENNIITNIPSDKIEAAARSGGVSPAYLMGWNTKTYKSVKIPVYGVVAAGKPIDAIENIMGYEEISEEMERTGDYFALKIKGDSMFPDIHDKDVVIVKRQPKVENGEIAIVQVNGEVATCKRIQRYEKELCLISLNPAYETMRFTPKEVESLPVTILGRVVEVRRKFK